MLNIEVHSGVYDQYKKDIERLFFNTSAKKEFKNEKEKAEFLFKYLRIYQEYEGGIFLAALDQNQNLCGYVCGSEKTMHFFDYMTLHPYYSLFKSYLEDFPAHLHINVNSESQGMGVGGMLIESFCNTLHVNKATGVHIITHPLAQNRMFYKKQHFSFEQVENYQGHEVLFMGRSLA